MSSPLAPFLVGVLDAFAPLERALHDAEAFRRLIRNLGWEKAFDAAVLSQQPLAAVAASASDLVRASAVLIEALDQGAEGTALLELLDLALATGALIEGLAQLQTHGLPESLRDPGFWAELALDLPEYLLVRYLEQQHGVLFALLQAAGVIVLDAAAARPSDDERSPYIRRSIAWNNLSGLVSDPSAHLSALYHWHDAEPFAQREALTALARVARSLGVAFERLPLRPKLVDDFYGTTVPDPELRELSLPIIHGVLTTGFAEHGAVLAPIPKRPGGDVDSIFIGNLSWGTAAALADIVPGWVLTVSGSADATGAVGVRLSPGETAFVAEPIDQHYEIAAEGKPAEPWHLIGGATGTRLEVNGLRLGLAFEARGEPELIFEARALPGHGRGAIALTIDPGDADSFLRFLISEPLLVDAELGLLWSSRSGISLGGVGLELTLPIDRTLGPLTIESFSAAVRGKDGVIAIQLGATLRLVLNPFELWVEDMGLLLELTPDAEDAFLAGLGVQAGFKPPDAIGFSLDIPGVVSGGGIIGHEREIGRWWGGLAFDFLVIGIQAVVVIDTQLPNDPDAWSFFASISATFPSLPLGFGFFLSGVGGLVCLNRTFDPDVLARALKDGAIDALLFPDDPLHDAPQIAASLDDWFPPAQGSSVFGVAAQIDWGAPKSLVRGQLGVIVGLPDLELAIVGSLSMVLPDERLPELELHLDSIGAIDVCRHSVSITAALYDSSIVGAFQLHGGMATYCDFGPKPYFLIAVGGFHPAFQPPGPLPASVMDLDGIGFEIALSEDIWFGVDGYVAVASNALQFGALATLEARMKALVTTYTATGSLGFDVVLTFSPFAFIADAHCSVDVSAGDKELFGAELRVHLEGPKPWYATAIGSITFFGLDVHFEVAFGGTAKAEAAPRSHVLAAVRDALASADAWRELAPDASPILFAAASAAPGAPRVRPDAELEVRQSLAPLDRELERYGAYGIDGPTYLTLRMAGLEGVPSSSYQIVSDWFAPAQFDVMTTPEKLAAPSYAEMTAGVRISGGALDFGSDAQTVTPDPETRILDADATRPVKAVRFDSSLPLATAPATFAASSGKRRVVSTRFGVGEISWTRIDPLLGTAIGQPGSYSAELRRLRTRRATDPAARIAPTASARSA
ncbi:MAG TPA: DUF6603 domain-containing protein [Polyangiaceae bacterium]|nr:DUF6603 domain-containing protein [Polyangiaceae bacterium]